jgi:transcriptional regulator with XRE-family HTH domain
MVMTSYDSPAAARRRLRLAVRKAREASGLTQGQVAEQLYWSISKVNRMENGEVTISPTDLSALLNLFGVNDRDVVNEMSRDAKAAKQRGWWHEARYREHVTPATLQLLKFESEATAIRCFQPTLFPGMLQARAYSEAVMNQWRAELPDADRVARLEVRGRRREQLFEQADPPAYLALVDESVVLRRIGGPAVMAEQLESVLSAIASHPSILLRIVPMADGAAISQHGAFTICDLEDEENAILHREFSVQDTIDLGGSRVGQYREAFERAWENAFSPDQSKRIILAQAATLRAAVGAEENVVRPR